MSPDPFDMPDYVPVHILTMQDLVRKSVDLCCVRHGYGATIAIAAQNWAQIEPMTPKGMALWLRSLADDIDTEGGGVGDALGEIVDKLCERFHCGADSLLTAVEIQCAPAAVREPARFNGRVRQPLDTAEDGPFAPESAAAREPSEVADTQALVATLGVPRGRL